MGRSFLKKIARSANGFFNSRSTPRKNKAIAAGRLRCLRYEDLERRRLLTATLTLSGTTLQFAYTTAAIAPSITGNNAALGLTFSTGGGESISIGAGITGNTSISAAVVTVPSAPQPLRSLARERARRHFPCRLAD